MNRRNLGPDYLQTTPNLESRNRPLVILRVHKLFGLLSVVVLQYRRLVQSLRMYLRSSHPPILLGVCKSNYICVDSTNNKTF